MAHDFGAARCPGVECNRGRGRCVERLDARRDRDPSALALPQRLGKPRPSAPTTSPNRSGKGVSSSSGPVMSSAISGALCTRSSASGGPDWSGT